MIYRNGMNRIAKLREQRGLTQADLAKLVNSTQPQIQRLERGERRLTEDWMRRIAAALGVDPADLLEMATRASFEDEVEPFLPEALSDLARPLQARSLRYYRVKKGSLELTGLTKGKIILADHSDDVRASPKAGDVLIVEISSPSEPPVRLLRQFLPPALLTTNREGRNTSINMTGEAFAVRVLGVVVNDALAATS